MDTIPFPSNYNLDTTLQSGQTFRWHRTPNGSWEGVIEGFWIRLKVVDAGLEITTNQPHVDLRAIQHYLQMDLDYNALLSTFPNDPVMTQATTSCLGLRLLRQDPWECLASFICSSTKQIVQIQEIIRLLCRRFGNKMAVPSDVSEPSLAFRFPTPTEIFSAGELGLRQCKLGFRAPYLLATAEKIASHPLRFSEISTLCHKDARVRLLEFPGVGPKIADCVLLFAYGFPQAFPVDVWVRKAIQKLYFPRARNMTAERIHQFSAAHFGPHSGYAQQFLFHYVRTVLGREW